MIDDDILAFICSSHFTIQTSFNCYIFQLIESSTRVFVFVFVYRSNKTPKYDMLNESDMQNVIVTGDFILNFDCNINDSIKPIDIYFLIL